MNSAATPEVLRYKLRDGEDDARCACCMRAIRRIVEIDGRQHGERCAKQKLGTAIVERAPSAFQLMSGTGAPSGSFARLDGETVRIEWKRIPGPLCGDECYAVGVERRYLGASILCKFYWAAA